MTTVLSLTYMRPKAQVRPSRHSKAMAPITQDLEEQTQTVTEISPTFREYEEVFSRAGSDIVKMINMVGKEGEGF